MSLINVTHVTTNVTHVTPNVTHVTPNVTHVTTNVTHVTSDPDWTCLGFQIRTGPVSDGTSVNSFFLHPTYEMERHGPRLR